MNLLARTHGAELGWKVAAFIPYLRKIAKDYEKVVIVCNEGEEYLCEFATSFEYMDKKGRSSGWLFKDKPIKMPGRFKRQYPDYKIVTPTKKNCTLKKREYKQYGEFNEDLRYDIVLHARAEVKYGRDDRNWPVARYVKLLKKLRVDRELSVCSIGSFAGAYHIKGSLDRRGVDLKTLCDIMASSRLCLGVSSGPIHLSVLCGCPVVVWADDEFQKWVGGSNRDRYKKLWNPYKVEAKVIEKYGWTPPVDVVVKAVNKMLRREDESSTSR